MKKGQMPVSLLDEVLVDLTNFLARPLRTGIQRYFTEILANWPDGHSLLPFILTEEREVAVLNPDIIPSISGYIRAGSPEILDLYEEEIRYFTKNPLCLAANADLLGVKAILLPEVTYDPAQLAFYGQALSYFREKVCIIVYDFIPWLRPELYPDLDFGSTRTSAYIDVLQKADNFAFISHKAKRDAEGRVLRRPVKDGLVLGGGADGLSFASAAPVPKGGGPEFVMVGTIQQRKRHFAVLDAAEALWRGGADFSLTFVGGAGDFLTQEERDRLEKLEETSSRFRWERSPLDAELAEIMGRATATLYPSVEEGLGLPVLESLWLNIPVIASSTLPVLDFLSGRGVRLVDPDRPEALGQVMQAFLAPGFAASVQAEIDRNALPTWRGVAARLQAWIDQRPVTPPEGRIPARRRLDMIRAIRDLGNLPPQRLVYEAFGVIFRRPPTGAELGAWLDRPDRPAGKAGAVVEWMVEAGAQSGALSPAERAAWLMSLDAARTLPPDFSFRPPVAVQAALVDRGVDLLRRLLGCPAEHFLQQAYQTILQRLPDPPGEADFRRFLDDHAHEARWARGRAIRSLVDSEECLALSGEPAFIQVIDDLLAIDVFSEEEVRCFRHVSGGRASRWLFAKLLDLRGEVFLRLATALVRRQRVSEAIIEPPTHELSREEKLAFLKQLCGEQGSPVELTGWIDSQLQA